MVQLLIDALGGDQRPRAKASAPAAGPAHAEAPSIECYHVDCRLSDDLQDIGHARWGKVFRLLGYCLEAIWCRFRYGVTTFYYVPAPGLRAPVYRDWVVMALCRPFFRTIIFHWHAVGLGAWLGTDAKPFERRVTRWLLGRSSLSIVLGPFYQADAAKLSPKRIEPIPNGIPDPCPRFETEVLPRRVARQAARAKLLAEGQARESVVAGDDLGIFRVLYLSLCMREKGLFDAIDAVAITNQRLSAQHSPLRVQLTVAGKFWHEHERKEFERRLAQPDLNGPALAANGPAAAVDFRGFVSGNQKDQLFRESDCFCFPSYYPIEGHPVSLLEAMAYGLPIITTRWRALPELFPPDYPGLVEPRAPAQVALILDRFAREDHPASLRGAFLEQFLVGPWAEQMKQALQGAEARR